MARPTKPTALKLVTGNPGKRALNRNEPEPDRLLDLSPPAHLSDRASAVWRELAPLLGKAQILTVIDVVALEMLCDFVSDYRHARSECGLEFVQRNARTGSEMLSQWFVAKSMASKRAEAFLAKFGMDPVSRSRVMVDPQGDLFGGGADGKSAGPGRFFGP